MDSSKSSDRFWWYVAKCEEGPTYQFYQIRASSAEEAVKKVGEEKVRLKLSTIQNFDDIDSDVISKIWKNGDGMFETLSSQMREHCNQGKEYVISDEWRSIALSLRQRA